MLKKTKKIFAIILIISIVLSFVTFTGVAYEPSQSMDYTYAEVTPMNIESPIEATPTNIGNPIATQFSAVEGAAGFSPFGNGLAYNSTIQRSPNFGNFSVNNEATHGSLHFWESTQAPALGEWVSINTPVAVEAGYYRIEFVYRAWNMNRATVQNYVGPAGGNLAPVGVPVDLRANGATGAISAVGGERLFARETLRNVLGRPNIANNTILVAVTLSERVFLEAGVQTFRTVVTIPHTNGSSVTPVAFVITPFDANPALSNAINAAQALSDADYTASSWSAMQAVLAQAIVVRNDPNATEAQITTATSELLGALDALVSLVSLRNVIATANALDESDFVGGWADMILALQAAEAGLLNPNITSTEIANLILALNNAIGALETAVDFSALRTSVNAVRTMEERYFSAGWTEVQYQLTLAEAVLENTNATEAQVSAAFNNLRTARQGLILSPQASLCPRRGIEQTIVTPVWLAYQFRSVLMDPVNGQLAPYFTYRETNDHNALNYNIDRYLPSWIDYHNRAPVFWTVEGYTSNAWRFVQQIYDVIHWLGTTEGIGGRHNLELNDGRGGVVDFIAMDGWVDSSRGGQQPNQHGYPLFHYRGWETVEFIYIEGERVYTPYGVSNEDFSNFVLSHGMIPGTYHNPLWLNMMYVYWPCMPHNDQHPFINRVTGAPMPDGVGWNLNTSNFNRAYNNPAFADLTIWNTEMYEADGVTRTRFSLENPELSAQYPNGLPLRYIVRRPSRVWNLENDGLAAGQGLGSASPQDYPGRVPYSTPNIQNSDGGAYSFQNWYIIDPFKPGAREYVKGMVEFYRSIGMGFMKVDFMRNNEESYGPMANVLALRWMREAAGTDFLISTANSRMRNFYEDGATYADMIRISEDQNSSPGWGRFNDQERGRIVPDMWRTTMNQHDATNFWANMNRRDGVILDGHQTKVFDYDMGAPAGVHTELKHVLGLKTLGGSGIQLSGSLPQLREIPLDIMFNPAMMELIEERFIAQPVESFVDLINDGVAGANPAWLNVRNDTNRRNTFPGGGNSPGGNFFNVDTTAPGAGLTFRPLTQIYYGQTENGDTVIGFFNRENTPQLRELRFEDIGLSGAFNVYDLWTSTTENPNGDVIARGVTEWSETLIGRGSRVIRIVQTYGIISSESELNLTLNGAAGEDQALVEARVVLRDGTPSTQGVTWISTNPEVASVTNGLVQALTAGTTTIRVASIEDPTLTFDLEVTVVDMAILPVSIVLDPTSATVDSGEILTVTATVLPETAGNRAVTWSSSNNAVASVDDNGVVLAIGGGTAIITATSIAAPTVMAEFEITVEGDPIDTDTAIVVSIQNDFDIRQLGAIVRDNAPRQIISLLPAGTQTGTLTANGQIQLRAVVEGAYDSSVTWRSLDPVIATVDETGLVTVLTRGTTTITATSNVDGRSAAQVFVHGAYEAWQVEAEAGLVFPNFNGTTPITAGTANRIYDLGGGHSIIRDYAPAPGTNINSRPSTEAANVSNRAMVGNVNLARGVDVVFNAPAAGDFNISVYYVQGSDAGHSPFPNAADPDRINARLLTVSTVPGDTSPPLIAQGTRGDFNQRSEFEPVTTTLSLQQGPNTIRIRGAFHAGDNANNAPNIDRISITSASAGVLGVIGNVTDVSGNFIDIEPILITENKNAVGTTYVYVDIYRDGALVAGNREIETGSVIVFSQQSIGGRTLNNGFVYAGYFPGAAATRISKDQFEAPGIYTARIRFGAGEGSLVSEPIFLFERDDEVEPVPTTEFDGTNPARLRTLLDDYNVTLQTRGNLGIFAQHSPFIIPEGRTLYIETTLNIQRDAELIIKGTVVVLEGGRINNQGSGTGGGTINITGSGRLVNYGHVENVTNSTINNYGLIINNARFEVRARAIFIDNGLIDGSNPLNINRDAIRIRP
ncbi:MAG: Ig-like domain-containing protein [Oscillospiraceae bacterium]|nr:Ig-like domain-containing protein [Oscillospiraceae bacterium]